MGQHDERPSAVPLQPVVRARSDRSWQRGMVSSLFRIAADGAAVSLPRRGNPGSSSDADRQRRAAASSGIAEPLRRRTCRLPGSPRAPPSPSRRHVAPDSTPARMTTRSAKIAPLVASRLARMRAGSTVNPEATCAWPLPPRPSPAWPRRWWAIRRARRRRRARAPERGREHGRHSAGIARAEASATAQPAGFRLCGIADDPPPASRASPTSACISRLMSRAILPSTPV